MRRLLVLAVALAAFAEWGVTCATAHNVGHFLLSDGSCPEIGSFKDAPLVGPGGRQDATRSHSGVAESAVR